MMIYKILRDDEWARMQAQGRSDGAPVDLADGYVHLSTGPQTPETLARHFAGQDGLTLLACDATAMGPALRWEVSRNGALFPHLYRALLMGDVVWTRPIALTPQGHVTGPLT